MENIKTTAEIINSFIEKVNFTLIVKEQNFPIDLTNKKNINFLDNFDALNLIFSASFAGNKTIGFFSSPLYFPESRVVRGECLVITEQLPVNIKLPIIFCRELDEMQDKLAIALKVSQESHLPVIVCINENVSFNYCFCNEREYDVDRVAPYLNKNTVDKASNNEIPSDRFAIAQQLLSKYLPDNNISNDTISFYSHESSFFHYIVPFCYEQDFIKNLEGKTLKTSENDSKFLNKLFKFAHIDVKLEIIDKTIHFDTKHLLCPGCPFAAIFHNIDVKNKLVLSDISCKRIAETFSIGQSSLIQAIGLSYVNPNLELLFIGNMSNYTEKYTQITSNMSMILLKDIQLKTLPLPLISKIYKFKGNNIIFPYSCENIPVSSKIKINPKRCVCIKKSENPHCIRKTLCPALYEENGVIMADNGMCVGCRICEVNCPYGAI